ncbi:MAG: hypothetical protein J7L95_00500 [Prolixibacteraceae bacterium]|nr:hypothetical protein [Prolixibacteraceae bacterium]
MSAPSGEKLVLPFLNRESPACVIDYSSKGKNVYLKDMGFDAAGNPACLYIRSNGHEPGPKSAPYEWCITKWNGNNWQTFVVTTSDHNYDMGSLFISNNEWKIVAPTKNSPQKWGVGGELEIWVSGDAGKSWKREKTITKNSRFNNSYVRRPVNYKAPFCFFWASGHPHEFSKSELWFGNFDGNIWNLPYDMKKKNEKPIKMYQ